MKKIVAFTMVVGMIFGFTACKKNKQNNTDISFVENTTQSEETLQPTTEQTTTSQTTANNTKPLSFNDTVVDVNNPIDRAISALLAEADTTMKINDASQKYYNAWKAEMFNAATLCKNAKVTGFTEQEYAQIESQGQSIYNSAASGDGGSSSVYSSVYSAGDVYKKGTYYYIALYKAGTGKDYTYIFK